MDALPRGDLLECLNRFAPKVLGGFSKMGYEHRSERRFGGYTGAKTSRKAPFGWPVRLRCRRVRDFSDSFAQKISETELLVYRLLGN